MPSAVLVILEQSLATLAPSHAGHASALPASQPRGEARQLACRPELYCGSEGSNSRDVILSQNSRQSPSCNAGPDNSNSLQSCAPRPVRAVAVTVGDEDMAGTGRRRQSASSPPETPTSVLFRPVSAIAMDAMHLHRAKRRALHSGRRSFTPLSTNDIDLPSPHGDTQSARTPRLARTSARLQASKPESRAPRTSDRDGSPSNRCNLRCSA